MQFNGINPEDVSVSLEGTSLKIFYTAGDSVVLNKYNESHSVRYIKFGEDDEAQLLSDFLATRPQTITGSGQIKGTNNDDKIIGSAKADTITALKGDDIVNPGGGNDVITGGEGRNTIVFEDANFGNDSVNLTEGENLTLDFTSYNDVNLGNLRYTYSGKNLVIEAGNHGKVTLNNFWATDVTGGDGAGVYLKLYGVTEPIDLREKEYFVAPTASYTGNWHNEIIGAGGVTKAITITGGKGNDTISGGSGKNTFAFSVGDGKDVITNAKLGDVIQIDALKTDLSYGREEDNLIIRYSDNDSITLFDYYTDPTASVDTIKAKNVSGKYEEIKIDPEGVKDTVYTIDETTPAKVELLPDSGYETLNFLGAAYPQYVNFSRVFDGEGSLTNDLKASYGEYDTEVILKNYFLGGHSVKFFKAATHNYDIPFRIGTDGDDSFVATENNSYAEFFYLKKGNDTITFAGKDYTSALAGGSIYSDGTSANKTNIILSNYSLADDELSFSYFENMGGYNKLSISFDKTDESGNHHGGINYEYYFDENKPTVQIKDSRQAVYTVDKIRTAATLNWLSTAEATKNHVAFLFADGINTVSSNNMTNYVYSDYDARLDYSYNGGKDKVTGSYFNDKYTVNTFGANTNLYISDSDGDSDTLDFTNTEIDSMRLLFDVGYKSDGEGGRFVVADPNSAFAYSGTFNSETLTNYLSEGLDSKWVNGVVNINAGSYNSETQTVNSGIEILKITKGTETRIVALDEWKSALAEDVCDWFIAQNFVSDSLSEAIENNELSSDQLAELYNLYNKKYTDIFDDPDDPVDENVIVARLNDGVRTVSEYSSENSLYFPDLGDTNTISFEKSGNNMEIKYGTGDDKLILTDFFVKEDRIDDFAVGNGAEVESIKESAVINVTLTRGTFVKSTDGCADYVVRIIPNGSNNTVTGLTSEDFVNFSNQGETYYELKPNGMNVMCDADLITISDFNPQDPPVICVKGVEDVFADNNLVVAGLSNFDGSEYGFATYSITGTMSADTLEGGAGEDVFVTYQGDDAVTGGEGADVFRFWTGHGVDTITDAEDDDTIIIDYMSDPTGASDSKTADDVTVAINDDGKVEITYSDADKIIIDNYDIENPASNIDTIKVITESGTTELSISELLKSGGDDPSGDDYEEFVPDYSCEEEPSAENTFVVNPTGYMSIKAEGNDLVFSWWDESDGSVERRLENYFTEGSDYKYISVNGEDPEILDEYCHIQIGTDANEIFTGMPDPEEMGPGTDDIIFAGSGNDKITGRGGTNYINAGEGNNKIYLSDEHSEEAYILNGDGSDTLIFPDGAAVSTSFDGDDLHISYYGVVPLDEPDEYGEITRYYDGSVVIENYSNGTSVQYAQIGDAEPIAIADFIDLYVSPTEENTLEILTNKNVDCSKDATNNLVFKYYDDDGNLVTETTTDEHKFVRIGYNGDPVSINNIQTGTDNIDTLNGNNGELIFAGGGNDNLTSGNSSDSLYLGSGNDTVTFGQHFGRDQIWSVGDSTNSDKLIFQNHSLVDRTLNFAYGETFHQDSDLNSIVDTKDLQIHSGTAEKFGGMGRFGGDIIYHDYFSYNTPNITITDSNGDTYTAERYNTAQTLDWTDATGNKVAFLDIAQFTDTSVVSGNNSAKANYVYSMGGGRLDYTYQGGIDTVDSASGLESANDNYNIASFNSNTDLILSDAGGVGDTMQINAAADNIRLIFDVGADVDGEEYYNNVYWYGMKLVHTDVFSAATLSEYLRGDADINGVTLNVNQEVSDGYTCYGYECGIEQVTTTDCITGIDMNAWKATITDSVKQWLDTYGVADKDGNITVSGTLKNMTLTGDELSTALDALYTCYNVNGATLEVAPVIDKGGITAVSSSASENWAFGTGNNNLTLTANIGADTITSMATKYNDKYTDTLNFTQMSFGDKLSIDINDKDVIIGDRTNMKTNSVTYTNFFDSETYDEQTHNKTVIIDSTGEYEVINRYVEAGHDFNYDDWTYERDKKYITLINNPNNKGGSIFSWTDTNIVHVTGDGDMGYAYMGGRDEVVSHGASEDYYNFNGGGYNNGEVNITNVFDANTKWTIRDFGGDNDEDTIRLQASIDDIALGFDCDKDGNVGNEILFIHKDAITANPATMKSALNPAVNWVSGVIKVEAPTESGKFGIEHVEYQANPYDLANEVNVDAWIGAIKQNITAWFSTYDSGNNYSSVSDALANCRDYEALLALANCYNVDYSSVNPS